MIAWINSLLRFCSRARTAVFARKVDLSRAGLARASLVNNLGGFAIFVVLATASVVATLLPMPEATASPQDAAAGKTNAAAAVIQADKQPAKKKAWIRLQGEGPVKRVFTVRVEDKGKIYYGRPLGQDSKQLVLLRWDGRITTLPRKKRLQHNSDGFAPYSIKELGARLQKQYGARYLTQSSKHFLVVHPRTKNQNWAKQYEAVFVQFRNYLAKRGIDIAEPKFPFVVVVLGSRTEFDRSLVGESIFKRNVYGYYSRISNRVTTYISTDPRLARQVDRLATVTLVHEAIHQVAFNTGVHNRLCAVPRWTSEGFAMLFESAGFRADDPKAPVAKRVNKRRLVTLRKMFQSGLAKGKLESMIRNDQLFVKQPELAYSLAWGLSFYLAETEKSKYLKFVIQDGNQKEFANYSPDERVTLFAKTFKTDFDTLEKKLKEFVMKL